MRLAHAREKVHWIGGVAAMHGELAQGLQPGQAVAGEQRRHRLLGVGIDDPPHACHGRRLSL